MLDFMTLALRLAEWRRHYESLWLAEAPFGALQQGLRNLQRAYALHQAQPPTFKKRGRSDGFRCSDINEFKVDQGNSRVLLPKIGWLRYRNSRKVLGRVRNVTVSVSCGEWFISILTERQVQRQVALGPAVGIGDGALFFEPQK